MVDEQRENATLEAMEMRLDTLTVGRFKNLRDFRVDFDEESRYTVLLERTAPESQI